MAHFTVLLCERYIFINYQAAFQCFPLASTVVWIIMYLVKGKVSLRLKCQRFNLIMQVSHREVPYDDWTSTCKITRQGSWHGDRSSWSRKRFVTSCIRTLTFALMTRLLHQHFWGLFYYSNHKSTSTNPRIYGE